MNTALLRFLHNNGNIATEGSQRSGGYALLYRMTPRVLYSAQYHRQHCTIQAFGQFGALYMRNSVDKHTNRPGFEPSTSGFRATTGPNEPSGFVKRE